MAMLDGLRVVFLEALSFADSASRKALVEQWNEQCEEVYKYKQALIAEERAKATADAAPRAEVAREIFEDIEKIAKTVGFPEALVNGMIVNHILDGLYIDSQDFAELKKKYTEGQK